MKPGLPIAAAIILAAAAVPAWAAGPSDLVKQAVAAEGGADKLRALKTLTLKGEADYFEPEQSMIAGGPPRPLGMSKVTIRLDLAKGLERGDFEHRMDYPFPGNEKYSIVVTPQGGAVTTDQGQRAMSAARLAFEWREMERISPALLLKAMDMPQNVSAAPDQKGMPSVAFQDGPVKFIILFDAKSHLPAVIRTVEDDDVHGDGHYDVMLGGWKLVAGAKVATSFHYSFNGLDKIKLAYSEATPTALPADTFAMSDAVKQAAKPPASGKLPWQSMLVSSNFGRWDDAQAEKNLAEGPMMHVNEITPTIQQVANRSHNSLIVALPDYLVVFDAPANDAYARWAIDWAKQKFPGKPIKYLVLTHHHMDHIGGARAYVAEGATIVVGKPDKAHIAKMFTARHTMTPDTLQQHPRKAKIIEVADRMSIKDGGKEIEIFRIANDHAEGMMIGYVLPEKLVWVTDIYSPGREKTKTPNNAAFYATIQKLGLKPDWYAGGHGTSGRGSDLEAIMAAK